MCLGKSSVHDAMHGLLANHTVQGNMAIDTSGKWWKGEGFADIADYMRGLTQDGYGAEKVLPSQCSCGGQVFRLIVDRDEGCAKRVCVNCSSETGIGDSDEIWADSSPKPVKCPCGNRTFELGVAFAFRESGDVRWIYVGHRCVKCGVLGCSIDWEIDYSPTDHLLNKT